jgi:hypothetical protein
METLIESRGMKRRKVLLPRNAIDVEKSGLVEHQRITVRGDRNQLDQVEIIYGQIREGAALMFYSEVNAILKAHIDPKSGISPTSGCLSRCMRLNLALNDLTIPNQTDFKLLCDWLVTHV